MPKIYQKDDRLRVEVDIYPLQPCHVCNGEKIRKIEGTLPTGDVEITKACEFCKGLGSERVQDSQPLEKIAFIFSPLTTTEKEECLSQTGSPVNKVRTLQGLDMYRKIMRYGLKAVEGYTNLDGTPYQLAKDDKGRPTEAALDEMIWCEYNQELFVALNILLTNIPKVLSFKGETGLRSDARIIGLTGEAAKNFQ